MSAMPKFKADLLRAGDGWHTPRRRLGRSTRQLTVAAAIAAAFAALIVAALTIGDARERPAPADRTAPAPTGDGTLLHVRARITVTSRSQSSDAVHVDRGTAEEWHRGRLTQHIERFDGSGAIDRIVGVDGVMRAIYSDGSYRVNRPSTNADSAHVIAADQRGMVAEFLRKYRRGTLSGSTYTIDGHRARRSVYRQIVKTIANGKVVDRRPGQPQYFYVDSKTGLPLGSVSTHTASFGRRGVNRVTSRTEYTVTKLKPSTENLAKLSKFVLVRRRDKDGCLVGPATNANNQLLPSDCGGTPGAPVAP